MGVCDVHRLPFYFGWSVSHKEWRGMWSPALYHFYLSSVRPSGTMINCQERVSCQLASDLFALCPNHLLRGERSCLSYYNGLYSHLCHGKGGLPWCGLLLSVARHCSCLTPICHLCAPSRYCLAERMLLLWLYAPTTLVPYTVNTHLTCQEMERYRNRR